MRYTFFHVIAMNKSAIVILNEVKDLLISELGRSFANAQDDNARQGITGHKAEDDMGI